MTLYVISANMNVHSNENAEKAMFESTNFGQSLLKKKDIFGKGKVSNGNNILRGIEKTTETHKRLKQWEKHRNMSRFLVFK